MLVTGSKATTHTLLVDVEMAHILRKTVRHFKN